MVGASTPAGQPNDLGVLTCEIEIEVEVSNPDYLLQFEAGSREKIEASDADYHTQVGRGSRPEKTHTRKIKTRIFSLRGLNRLGIYSRTEVGMEFHDWVLDILDGSSFGKNNYEDHRRLVEYFFSSRPRWKKIAQMFHAGVYSIGKIARQSNMSESSVNRALRLMNKRGIIDDYDYQRGRADSRHMVGFWNERQLNLDM